MFWYFPDDVFWRLVDAKTLKNGDAHDFVVRPFGK